MQEDFLHYIWKYKKFVTSALKTVTGKQVQVITVGDHNLNSGPDFFNAKIKIAEQLWAGNVEIHVKSSDWFLHNHELDKNYDNVILHVVWQHDTEVYRSDNSILETLELQNIVSQTALLNYKKLYSKKQKWINCEQDFASIDNFVINNWLERLYFERLERKSKEIEEALKVSKNNWEAVLFKMLAKNFGLKVNAEAFLSLVNSFAFAIVQKQANVLSLEALFFGQANLLESNNQDAYFMALQKEYRFLKQKYKLQNNHVVPFQFFRLRPSNFPTIRLSQLASLYSKQANLFSKIVAAKSKEEIYKLFQVEVSTYWENHYKFDKESKKSKKRITKSFIDLLIINTIIPLLFCYANQLGKDKNETILKILNAVSSEKNNIVAKFQQLKPISKSAMQSQALLQLKTEYCDKNKCLQCAIGNKLLAAKN